MQVAQTYAESGLPELRVLEDEVLRGQSRQDSRTPGSRVQWRPHVQSSPALRSAQVVQLVNKFSYALMDAL